MGSLIRYRFGVFELDPEILELRKAGRLVRLRPQGLKLLKLLVSRPREVIAREEMARSLWDAGVFVDFEQGLNHTINQLRAALGDDAESPRYIETLPRRGYRFIAPVEVIAPVEALVEPTPPAMGAEATAPPAPFEQSSSVSPRVIGWLDRRRIAIAVTACALLSIVGVGWSAMFRPPAASSTIPSVVVLPFSTIGYGG